MAQESQHDEVGVQTIQTMANVGIVVRLGPGLPYVLHDFVFPLSRYVVAGKDHLAYLPVRILTYFLVHEVLELLREFGHEHGTY